MQIRLTQIDGSLPNLALMKLSHWHKSRGDNVVFSDSVHRDMYEPEFDVVYGSSIFKFSEKATATFLKQFPNAIMGGTGTTSKATVEHITGEHEFYDYSIYPDYLWSIGFTQRGCRLKCKFCVVPEKEGKPKSVNTIQDIWRPGSPKNICLLDNDFFGQPRENFLERIKEIKEGGFKVCFNQGINIRLITEEAASLLATLPYYDDQFKQRRLYTAWDNLKDEAIFFRGVDVLEKAGVPPKHLMVYMLIGFDPSETWDRIFHRFHKMVERGIKPYPMVFDRRRTDLKRFQRWVIRRYYEFIPWEQYGKTTAIPPEQMSL